MFKLASIIYDCSIFHYGWRGLANVKNHNRTLERTGHVALCFLANGVMILVTYSTVNLEDLLTTTPQQFTGDGLAMWCCVSWVMVSCVLSKNFESKKNWSKLVKMSINGQSSPISWFFSVFWPFFISPMFFSVMLYESRMFSGQFATTLVYLEEKNTSGDKFI